ncbi:MAG: hypothetical protein C4297_10100 [Gemmataceae bacterium]
MKKLLIYIGVGLVLFGLSAAGSWWWINHTQPPTGEAETQQAEANDQNKNAAGTHDALEKGSAGYVPSANPYEEGAQLVLRLRERLKSLKDREIELENRSKQLDVIWHDLKLEREELGKYRKQILEESKALAEQAAALEKKHRAFLAEKEQMQKDLEKLASRLRELEAIERENLKKTATMFESMAPENAAKIIGHLAANGNMDMAANLLSLMRERQAAKVLAELPEGTAAQLLEKLRSIKKSTTPAGQSGAAKK